jgi:hypothetical protein
VILDALALPLALVVGALGASRLTSALARSDDAALPVAARVTIGVAALSALAGVAVAAHLYSRAVALLLLGIAAGGLLGARRPRDPAGTARARFRVADALWLAPTVVFLGARTLGGLRHPHYNPCDDWVVYLHFPRLLLESGGFDEPFSMRRLGVLGAGPFVQGFFWPALGISANTVADAVFGQIAVVGGALTLRDALARPDAPRWHALAFVLLALAVSVTIPHLNTLPTLLPYGGTLLLLALHARLVLRAPDAASTRDALLFGVLAAWLIGLRVSNAPLPAALWALELARAAWQRDRARLRLGAVAALATGAALLPWCLSLWQSSGTPLFPLFRGNHRFASLFSEPLTPRQLARYVAECLTANRAPFLAALAALAFARREQRALVAQVFLATGALLVSAALGATAFDSFTVLRYCAPLALPAFLAFGAIVALEPASPAARWRRGALVAIAAAWLLMPVMTHRVFSETPFSQGGIALRQTGEWLDGLRRFVADPFTPDEFGGRRPYEEAQRLLPPEARVVSAAEQAYLWRHDLHVVHSLDCLGQASPDPGMPFFAGAEAMASYFESLGYTHLAFTPPRRSFCLYSDTHWRSHKTKGQWMWRMWAPYFLDFMATQRELARTREVVFRGPTLVVLDLRARRAAEAPGGIAATRARDAELTRSR